MKSKAEQMHNQIIQEWHPNDYQQNARFVPNLAGEIIKWLDPKKNEEILDIGCADAILSEKIAKTGANVTGIDQNEEFVKEAKKRIKNVRRIDANLIDYQSCFDAVFSNAVLHWINTPQKVLGVIHKALKPNGRFVAEFGAFGNVASIVTAMRATAKIYNADQKLAGPWFFPTQQQYQELLQKTGFINIKIEIFHRQTYLEKGIRAWLMTFRKPFFQQFDANKRSEVIETVVELLKPSLCDHKGSWYADYVRLRVKAIADKKI